MGEVYRGRDTKLDREIAIKVLPAAMARDNERLVRFEREAKALAALNHPNIAQIYGVEGTAMTIEPVPREDFRPKFEDPTRCSHLGELQHPGARLVRRTVLRIVHHERSSFPRV